MSGPNASSAGLDPRRRRVLFRAWHRGMREMDLIMGRFAEAELPQMSEGDLDALEALMEEPDPAVFGWLIGEVPVPASFDTAVFRKLRAFNPLQEGESGRGAAG